MSDKPIVATLWRLEATMTANADPGTLFEATIYIPRVLESGEDSFTILQLNYPFIIEDGYIEASITPDAQLVVVANDGEKFIYSNPLNHTLIQSGRPRVPLFKRPLYVRPMTKLKFYVRNLDKVGTADVTVKLYLKVRPL